MARLILVVLILVFIAGTAGCMFPLRSQSSPTGSKESVVTPTQGGTPTATPARIHLMVDAQVDGRSDLRISRGAISWRHFDNDAPGRFDGASIATYLNGEPWMPSWPEAGPQRWCGGCDSGTMDLSRFGERAGDAATVAFATADPADAQIRCIQCEAPVRASYSNGVFIAHFDDDAHGGWSWYVIDITLG